MKQKDKLRAYWSKKENDLMYWYPAGVDVSCDSRLLHNVFAGERCHPNFKKPFGVEFSPSFIKELESRGYDLTTIRFSIEPKKGNQKFVSQQPADEEAGKEGV